MWLLRRTWSLIWGAIFQVVILLPNFRHFRVLNILGIIGTTFTALCALISSAGLQTCHMDVPDQADLGLQVS